MKILSIPASQTDTYKTPELKCNWPKKALMFSLQIQPSYQLYYSPVVRSSILYSPSMFMWSSCDTPQKNGVEIKVYDVYTFP